MAPTATEIAPEVETKAKTEKERLYNLVVFDDDEHSYAYVIEMMVAIFNMTQQEGFDIAYLVDHNGEAVVKTCGFEEAIAGRDAIHSFGPDYRTEGSTGSMRSGVFEAE